MELPSATLINEMEKYRVLCLLSTCVIQLHPQTMDGASICRQNLWRDAAYVPPLLSPPRTVEAYDVTVTTRPRTVAAAEAAAAGTR